MWCADPLNNLFGRRGAIFLSACFCLFPVLACAFTQFWVQLIACRILLGIGMGMKSSTTSVLAPENAPALIRGALTMTWQLYVAFGILLGLSANLAVVNTGAIAWRLQLGSSKGGNPFERFTQLFTIPRIRRAILAAGTVMLAQQMCGKPSASLTSSSINPTCG